jgi:hypothetical protein
MRAKMPFKKHEDKKAYMRRFYKENRAKRMKTVEVQRHKVHKWYLELKTTYKCSRCPESHPSCLDFHHIDPKTKRKGLADLSWKGSRKLILEEIKKCECLCSNCHRKEQWEKRKKETTMG